MKPNRLIFPLAVAGGAFLALTACASLVSGGAVGNPVNDQVEVRLASRDQP